MTPSRRIIAIGDLHGALDSLLEIAGRLGIVDGRLDLDLADTDLVFVGDICDRGTNSRAIYELIIRWQEAAPRKGSRVWFLLGNHEVMNCFGMRQYNTVEEYLSFDGSSRAAGRLAHEAAFAPGGWLSAWLASQQVMVKLGTLIFAHADLPRAIGEWSVEEINARALAAFRNVALAAPGRRPPGIPEPLPAPLFAPEASVLWCREAQVDARRDYPRVLRGFLARNGARVYVCGHTPAEEGAFRLLHGGRYLCIDTAMTFERSHAVGRKSALLVGAEGASALYCAGGDLVTEALDLPGEPPVA